MAMYSKAHEREEKEKMWKGFRHSTLGILLCWLPVIGQLFAISGFCRQVVRLTDKYKKRMALFLIYGLAALALAFGVLMYELYQYGQNPNMPQEALQWAWKALTGQDTLPGQTPAGVDYSNMADPGLGAGVSDFPDFPEDEGEGEFDPNADADLLTEMPDDELIEGDTVPDDATAGEESLPEVGAATKSMDETAEGEDEFNEEDFVETESDEMFYELDFGYEVVDDMVVEVNSLQQVNYKVLIDKEQPTEQEMKDLFSELIYEDGYDLHTIAVYLSEEETEQDYTVAYIDQTAPGGEPVVTMKT